MFVKIRSGATFVILILYCSHGIITLQVIAFEYDFGWLMLGHGCDGIWSGINEMADVLIAE